MIAQRLRVAILLALFAGAAAAYWETPPTWPILALGMLHGGIAAWAVRWLPALLIVDLGLVAWHASGFPSLLFGTNYDTWMHLAMVRRVLEHGLFPPDAYYWGFGAAPVTSLVHYLYAVVAAATGLRAHELWRFGPPIAVMFLGASAYWMHRELLRDRAAALFAALFVLASQRYSWHYATYPRALAPALYLVALAFLWRSLRTGANRSAVAAGIALGLTFTMHPVTGAMCAFAMGAALTIEWITRASAGEGRSFTRVPLLVVAVSAFTAAPMLVADVLAWLSRLDVAPIAWSDTTTVAEYLAIQLDRRIDLSWFEQPAYTGWLWLWAAPTAVGVLGLALRRAPDRLLAVYAGATAFVTLVAVYSPLTPLFERVFAPRYTARFAELLPLPALAGFGLSLARARGPWPMRAAGALAVALFTAGLLRGVEPWRPNAAFASAPQLERPELSRLEPLLRGRIVLADRLDAYVLPYYTGAYTAWNYQGHTNPWLYDERRSHGAREILAGRWSPGQALAWCDHYRVDFVLLPASRARALQRLLATEAFRKADASGDRVLLERIRGADHSPT